MGTFSVKRIPLPLRYALQSTVTYHHGVRFDFAFGEKFGAQLPECDARVEMVLERGEGHVELGELLAECRVG